MSGNRLPLVVERGSLPHRTMQLLGVLAVVMFFLYVTGVAPNFSALRWSIGLTIAIAIQGLNIVTGYSGQISVGHSAFFGIGAYTTMILVADYGWPFLATLPVGGALGFAVGFVIGIPALRIRGLYLALITLGLALAFPAIVKSDNFFGIDFAAYTGGSNGLTITGGDVTSTEGFRWVPPSWAPSGWSANDWVFTTLFVDPDRAVRADVQPRPQPRRPRARSPCATTRPGRPCQVSTRRSSRSLRSPRAPSSPPSAAAASPLPRPPSGPTRSACSGRSSSSPAW